MGDKIQTSFMCPICNQTHKIYLNKNEVDKITNFPFSNIVRFHEKAIIVYIDSNYKVRGAEQIDLYPSESQLKFCVNNVDGMVIKGEIHQDKTLGKIFIQK